MYGSVSVSLASLAFFYSSVQALPFNAPLDSSFFDHPDPAWSQSASITSSAEDTYLTGSGFLALPTASGYAWPSGTGSGTVWPVGTATGTGHAYSTGTAAATSTYSSSSATATTTTASAAPAVLPNTLRGVNIGNWLILEKWMGSDLFDNTDATDQYSFDSTDGAEAKLQEHWSTYFTEQDVAQIASWGLNSVRIPIGYWAYDNTGTPYISGADEYLEKAIGWCRTHGIKVLVDCHGSPGSQNGFDNSGRAGNVAWQSDDNLQLSISILETIAKKYGAQEYADVVFGIELVNEPISWDQNNFETTKQWAQEAYSAVKAAATNPDLNVIMHDGFMGPSEWQEISTLINGDASLAESKFWIDTHQYQNQEAADSYLTQDQHVEKACNWSSSVLLPASSNLPVIVGEFSAATNICANPDGSTVAGNTCDIDGCQCSANVPIENWNEPLLSATRKFLEAELDTFEGHSRGWFMWSYQGAGAWGYANAVKYGIIGKDVTARNYPGQCSSS
ncbi:hypothetical protein AAFC00_005170 [Neodothiora populina]|uniref:glucan 1,3-beta-glucosidase n=1 Tax=Neodothiora populina TaxID=2781224 RepID=A0ABR3PK14_9PEZI